VKARKQQKNKSEKARSTTVDSLRANNAW